MFHPNITALAVCEHAKSYVKYIYLYLDIYSDNDITHVTADVKSDDSDNLFDRSSFPNYGF